MATANDQGPSSQILRLQDEITREVNNDAQHLATSVFGKLGAMPDVARLPDEVVDARYRTAYQNQDRQWLLGEAQRDPEQFVKVARRIGVVLPEEIGQTAMPAPQPSLPPPPQAIAPAPPVAPPGGMVPAPVPIAPLPQAVPQPPVQAPAQLLGMPPPQVA